MLNPSATLVVSLIALPAIFAQSTNTTSSNITASSNVTAVAPGAPANNPTFAPTTFTPVLATSTTCGTAQQNFNQCITKVGKDISSCTDNVCLCQTYANIAACYNGCPDLTSQGEAYQSQSTQYCSIAGVKPNTTATVVTPTTTNTSTSKPISNTTPVTSTSTSNVSTNANTFSAAKGSASSNSPVSLSGLFVASVAALSALLV